MTRAKLLGPAIKTREQAVEMARECALIKINERLLTAKMDEQITAIRAQYQDSLSEAKQMKDEKLTMLEAWAEAHPEEFGKAKSLNLIHATIGWRTGQPQVKTAKGWTWDRVLEKLESAITWAGFIRIKKEVDKAAIIAARDQLLDGDLKAMGVKIVQEEPFFLEPKTEESAKAA